MNIQTNYAYREKYTKNFPVFLFYHRISTHYRISDAD